MSLTCRPNVVERLTNRGRGPSSYRIEIAESPGFNALAWDSGSINSTSTHLIKYTGPALKSDTDYFWRVTSMLTDGDA